MHSVQVGAPSPRAAILAAAQLTLVAAWLVVLFGTDSDPTATTIDWKDVALWVLIPLTFALSYWAGRVLKKSTPLSQRAVARYFVRLAQGATLALLVLTLLLAPVEVLADIVFEPIG